jgi:glycerol-1-phosphate dehydrogenase [NAD(P)+]
MTIKDRVKTALSSATDTKYFESGRGVLDKVPEVFGRYFPGRVPIVIADCNTWKAAGERVFALLSEAGMKPQKFLIPEREFHAEWKYVEMIDKVLDGGGVAVSVGSGTINDLCKLSSAHHKQSYLSVATAASVDGYTSFGASITFEGAKQTFECPAPVACLADADVLCSAPKELTAAGYADLAAKIPAGAEWMIADFIGTEPIIPDAWHPLQDCIDDILANAEAVAAGDHEAIGAVFDGLALSGFGMQTARSSRPASASDHLFSHIMDMTHHKFNGKYVSHGFQVAIGTLTMCKVFENFFKLDLTRIDVDKCTAAWPSLESEQKRALDIFKDFPVPELGYREITKKYEPAEKVRQELTELKAQWPDFRKKLMDQLYTFDDMQEKFRIVGAPAKPEDIGCTKDDIIAMFPFVQLMRYRINLFDLAKRAGVYDEIIKI